MPETLMRQWEMLRMIPRAPRKIAASQLQSQLQNAGYPVDLRTVQRDLNALSRPFALLCDVQSRPHGWSWSKNAVFDVPGMDSTTALTFSMAKQFLCNLMPQSQLGLLEPHFKQAHAVLAGTTHGRLGDWPKKVRVLPRGHKLLSARVDDRVRDLVHDALLTEKRLRVSYRTRGSDTDTEYVVNPLTLVVRDAVLYLVCTLWEYDDLKQLALHRMKEGELLDVPARLPEGFNIDTYIAKGEFGMPMSSKSIRLVVLLDPWAAVHLRETRLSEDQTMEEQDDDRLLLKATVLDTGELRWWLLGFGDGVEVLKPVALRREFSDVGRRMADKYRRSE